MFSSNYLITRNGDYATLFARIKGRIVPLVSSEDSLEIDNIYHNIRSGAKDFIVKPFKPERILRTVSSIIGEP